ncbi:hypothetical protein [Microbacterium immunditiarum]|uniref:Uncharacterized protein n=1 Tax=Microbacterium immunditiarum TaxID=337480 RepID=A0A7Y9GPU4_9MICO|nr:hypothetical protein [Microbacterium immunditiarum]NYE20473.1 hypothetical protein [Microbacterium immunditiarum]
MDEKALLDDRLMAAYRPMRTVSGGDESPWPGTLVRAASGHTCVVVESRRFGAEWPGWSADPEGHVLGALDLIRRVEGHDVVVPVCVERVDAFVRRREASGAPLSLGETVTLAVSVVRGFAELTPVGGAVGRWWVTDTGRPLFACGVAGDTVAQASAELLRALEAPRAAAALDEAVRAVLAERPSRQDLDAVEQRLFDLARPEPLALTVFGPRRARATATTDAPADAPWTRRRSAIASSEDEPRGLLATILRHIDADLGDAASRVATDVWRRLRSVGSGGRRKPWLLAGGLAAAIVTGGFVWPAGADDAGGGEVPAVSAPSERGEDAPRPHDATSEGNTDPGVEDGSEAVTDDADEGAASDRESTDAAAAPEPAPGDLVTIANELLSARSACAGGADCLSNVVEDPSAAFPPGVVDLPTDARSLSLVDEFGGVAVLRVERVDGASAAQLVVVVRGGEGWLLRDVYDVESD